MPKNEKGIVTMKTGKVKGTYRKGLYTFKGIPYAAPPVGKRRWLPPAPAGEWSGVRPMQSFGNAAAQQDTGPGITPDLNVTESRSEDCLYLNVWSPGLDDARRPVLVWIHGGAFTMGSGAQAMFDGNNLARRGDAVIVTINYRLGVMGFLRLNEITGGGIPATGNEGLLDHIAALQWVRDNIAAFGGDHDNVTVFGESSGAMSIGCLMAMPSARGLFQKAILQSGAAHTATTSDEATRLAAQRLEILGLDAKDADVLQALPVERLLAADAELAAMIARQGGRQRITLSLPVIDGKTLLARPIGAIRRGSAEQIPVLVGTNLDEWRLIGLMDQDLPGLDESGLAKRCRYYMPEAQVTEMIKTYRNARARRGNGTSPPEIFTEIQTHQMFRIPAIRLIEAQRRFQSAYNYLFTWKSAVMGGVLGACHVLETGFVFGTHNDSFCGSGPVADRLARNIQDAWLAFARTGEPGAKSIGKWPPYGERRVTMLLGEDCHTEEAPYDEERRAWDTVPDEFIGQI